MVERCVNEILNAIDIILNNVDLSSYDQISGSTSPGTDFWSSPHHHRGTREAASIDRSPSRGDSQPALGSSIAAQDEAADDAATAAPDGHGRLASPERRPVEPERRRPVVRNRPDHRRSSHCRYRWAHRPLRTTKIPPEQLAALQIKANFRITATTPGSLSP